MIDQRIETFLTLCDTLSYTKTASILNITQPAVTQHIKHLEKTYNDKLFTYNDKRLKLTTFGYKYHKFCIALRANISSFEKSIKLDDNNIVDINFGATKTIGEFLIKSTLLKYYDKYPNSDIHVLVENTAYLLQLLEKGDIDFAIIEGYFDKSKYASSLLKIEEFICVGSIDLNVPINVNSFNDLFNYRLLLREKGSGTRQILEQALAKQSFTINSFHNCSEISSFNVIKELLKHNMGITFCYRSVVQKELKSGILKEITINNFNEYREFNYVYLYDKLNHDSLNIFKDCFIDLD